MNSKKKCLSCRLKEENAKKKEKKRKEKEEDEEKEAMKIRKMNEQRKTKTVVWLAYKAQL